MTSSAKKHLRVGALAAGAVLSAVVWRGTHATAFAAGVVLVWAFHGLTESCDEFFTPGD